MRRRHLDIQQHRQLSVRKLLRDSAFEHKVAAEIRQRWPSVVRSRGWIDCTYQQLLDGTYDCLDRIVLNAYFRLGHDAGGFRVWWRRLTGSEENLDNAHLMRMAGRVGRRLRAWARANDNRRITRKAPMPYVNHYSLHILDRE